MPAARSGRGAEACVRAGWGGGGTRRVHFVRVGGTRRVQLVREGVERVQEGRAAGATCAERKEMWQGARARAAAPSPGSPPRPASKKRALRGCAALGGGRDVSS